MSTKRLLVLALVVSTAVYAWFTWPLPRHALHGIPSSSQNIEKGNCRRMIVGDHLQLLYNYWLVSEMVTGEIPFLHNTYEFNEGDDSARYEPRHYHVPFSIVYAILAWITGKALAYNLTALLSLWLALFFTLLLVRRYVAGNACSTLAATISIVVPYRWVALLGGSPTGLAMMWVPVMLLGVDLAVRDGKTAGGVVAGLALLLARLCDIHVFFFGALLAPCWCFVALVGRAAMPERSVRARAGRIAWALLPGALLSLFAVVYRLWRGREFGLARIDAARDVSQLSHASPLGRDVFLWRGVGVASHVYLGYALPLLVLTGILVLALNSRRGRWRPGPATAAGLLLGLLVLVGCLALGPNGPFNGVVFLLLRRLVPAYGMIREPARVFCVVPSLLAVLVAFLIHALCQRWPHRRWPRIACVGVLLAGVAEYGLQVRPTVCLLEEEQPAYAAVAGDVRRSGDVGRILVLPIWPGDISWTSAPQYYISLYRLRMLNGYSPIVRREYRREVYARFESMNRGDLNDTQLDDLLRKGIRYVVLHEDAFPENASPFSVWFTLRSLLHHPRLSLLARHEAVWAFRVLPEPAREEERSGGNWNTFSSAGTWHARECRAAGVQLVETGRGAYVRLAHEGASLETEPVSVGTAPGLRYLVRARGSGLMWASVRGGMGAAGRVRIDVSSGDWDWYEVPVGRLDGLSSPAAISVSVERGSGTFEVDYLVLCAGVWTPPRESGRLDVPAASFFHAGYTDGTDGSVVLRAGTDAGDVVFYGPDLPLPAGEYEIRLAFDSPAEPGREVGRCFVRAGQRDYNAVPVRVGEKAACYLPLAETLPVRFSFEFARTADVRIHHVSFIRH